MTLENGMRPNHRPRLLQADHCRPT